MYERFTDRSRKVMQLANQEAQRFNHEYIGTEHILLGLVQEGSGVAANVLKNLDIDLRTIRREVERIVQIGANSVFFGRLPQTPRTKKVIEYAIEESQNLKHNYVGTEHLLLGLLREFEGVAAQVLMNLGLKLEDVREEVLNLLGHNMPIDSTPVPDDPVFAHIVKSLNRKSTEESGISDPPAAEPGPPKRLTDEQLRAVRARIRLLTEQKDVAVEAQDFERAAHLREEAVALKRLLAWYEWHRQQP